MSKWLLVVGLLLCAGAAIAQNTLPPTQGTATWCWTGSAWIPCSSSSGGGGGPATIADGADVTQGAKADARSTATDTTPITVMSVLKQISFSIQAAAASLVTIATNSGAAVPSTTYLGTITLAAATSTQLIAANVTMAPNSAALPGPTAFQKLTILIPSACSVTVNWFGGTATATSGEQMGGGTNVGTDTVTLTGGTNAPTLFSTAGCSTIQFRN